MQLFEHSTHWQRPQHLFIQDGEIASLHNRIDWRTSPLGPMEHWPQSLKTTFSICLQSKMPMFVWWGPDLINLYNDAFIPLVGLSNHPEVFGRPAWEMWPDIWESTFSKLVEEVFSTGDTLYYEDLLFPIERNGREEDAYFSFSYGPALDDEGFIKGIICSCYETTAKVLIEKEHKVQEELRNDLARKKYQLQKISDASSTLMSYVDAEEHITFVNASTLKALGRTLENTVGHDLNDVYGKELYSFLHPYALRALAGESVSFEWHAPHDEYYFITYVPDIGKDGQIHGFISNITNITEVKAKQAMIKQLADSMPQIVWTVDPDGVIDYVNRRFKEYTGLDERHLKDEWYSFIHPNDRAKTKELWEQSLATKRDFEIEYRLRAYDGNYHWHLGRATAAFDCDGNITKWFGTNTDIHESKIAEQELNRLFNEIEFERSRFEAVMKQMPGAVIVGEAPTGKLLFANDKMDEVWGHDLIKAQGDVIEYREWVGFHPDGRKYRPDDWPLSRSIQKGEVVTDEDIEIIRKDGARGVLRLNSTPIKDRAGNIVAGVVICQDVTQLKDAIRARDEFLSIASHELKTPLTSLRLQFQLEMRLISKNDPKAFTADKIMQMTSQGDKLVTRLARLVDDMLDISRIRSGKLTIDKQMVDIGDIVKETVERMKPIFTAAGCGEPSYEICSAVGYFDSMRIEQVINNLLTNALRYGLGQKVEVRLHCETDKVLLTVEDFGMGISQAAQVKIFDRFERAVSASEISGLGLGLFIVKQIVIAHGGKIWVESILDKGSKFSIELPLNEEEGVKIVPS